MDVASQSTHEQPHMEATTRARLSWRTVGGRQAGAHARRPGDPPAEGAVRAARPVTRPLFRRAAAACAGQPPLLPQCARRINVACRTLRASGCWRRVGHTPHDWSAQSAQSTRGRSCTEQHDTRLPTPSFSDLGAALQVAPAFGWRRRFPWRAWPVRCAGASSESDAAESDSSRDSRRMRSQPVGHRPP